MMSKIDREQQEVKDMLVEARTYISEAITELKFESFESMQYSQRNLIFAARDCLKAASQLYTHMRLKGG